MRPCVLSAQWVRQREQGSEASQAGGSGRLQGGGELRFGGAEGGDGTGNSIRGHGVNEDPEREVRSEVCRKRRWPVCFQWWFLWEMSYEGKLDGG